eukprot:gb/GECH01006040.1/.p1 GENE.gb/GECH01006040.1/~~gb/GECH01006040.1/.p1  ORF type:complete len:234 (+),score=61.06 gb/GECH01006040.1/:1-702(+)
MESEDFSVEDFTTYEDYLDAHVTQKDLYYLEDQDIARQIVELGYKGKDILSREQFDKLKRGETDIPTKTKQQDELASAGKNLVHYPLLQELADREELVKKGKLSTIIFIRDIDKRGHEVSGYIDYGARLQNEDLEEYFSRKRKLMPRPTDLSYYNWKTLQLSRSDSPTFQILPENGGLVFKHKRYRKTINVDPKANPGDNAQRFNIKTDEYLQVVLYDFYTRRKARQNVFGAN